MRLTTRAAVHGKFNLTQVEVTCSREIELELTLTMDKPPWAEALHHKGTYFKGFVDDATTIVEKYKAEILTTSSSYAAPRLGVLLPSKWN